MLPRHARQTLQPCRCTRTVLAYQHAVCLGLIRCILAAMRRAQPPLHTTCRPHTTPTAGGIHGARCAWNPPCTVRVVVCVVMSVFVCVHVCTCARAHVLHAYGHACVYACRACGGVRVDGRAASVRVDGRAGVWTSRRLRVGVRMCWRACGWTGGMLECWRAGGCCMSTQHARARPTRA